MPMHKSPNRKEKKLWEFKSPLDAYLWPHGAKKKKKFTHYRSQQTFVLIAN